MNLTLWTKKTVRYASIFHDAMYYLCWNGNEAIMEALSFMGISIPVVCRTIWVVGKMEYADMMWESIPQIYIMCFLQEISGILCGCYNRRYCKAGLHFNTRTICRN